MFDAPRRYSPCTQSRYTQIPPCDQSPLHPSHISYLNPFHRSSRTSLTLSKSKIGRLQTYFFSGSINLRMRPRRIKKRVIRDPQHAQRFSRNSSMGSITGIIYQNAEEINCRKADLGMTYHDIIPFAHQPKKIGHAWLGLGGTVGWRLEHWYGRRVR